ncbi:hypothetical protein ERX37_01915 [Macrococcus hajekii]|uniref:Heat-inducible transcription repressor HrcA n=1 Tax=Macrococcus hajekii TaxID=198482 RepID=A0A4R6BM29_9STAP|nr:hypothetical protein [Macrococcus hajekii]TDM02869.1 hypothetical protein ERX37_01915 [Macrococcus hajekii]GGB04530.1 heat-inducible transcription repressor HrcA [Macrococcus hajekii]
MLTNRQETLLNTLVEDFVESGVPVGSKTLMTNHQLSISSATIRAELKKLEEQGFIQKTHISSGRIPSLEGYRHYIRTLQHEHQDAMIQREDVEQLADYIAADMHYFSVVTGHKERTLKSIHIAAVSRSLLIVLIYSDGDVDHEQLDWHETVTMEEIQQINEYLNAVLYESNAIKAPFNTRLVSFIEEYVDKRLAAPDPVIHRAGQEFLFEAVAHHDVQHIKNLLSFIESDAFISKLISMNDDLINVRIGQEIDARLTNVSLVTKPVHTSDFDGRVAVMGPIVMSYRKVFESLSAL